MIKYKDYYVVFEEIPDKITLAINITNCQNHCVGCHSPELRRNIGEELTEDIIRKVIEGFYGINCICFMGEGKDPERICELSDFIHTFRDKKILTAIYVGGEKDEVYEKYWKEFDYVKYGPYKEEFGPLNKETTNQRLMKKDENGEWTDITYKFWKRG